MARKKSFRDGKIKRTITEQSRLLYVITETGPGRPRTYRVQATGTGLTLDDRSDRVRVLAHFLLTEIGRADLAEAVRRGDYRRS